MNIEVRSRLRLAPVLLAVACYLLMAAGCGRAAARPQPLSASSFAPELSRKLHTFIYIEEGQDLIFTLGVRAAAFHEDDPYFPLEVSMVNKQKGTTWVVTREAFGLLDEGGNRYEAPANQELAAGYIKRTFDSKLFSSRPVTANKHEGYIQVESSFFPDPLRGLSRRSLPTGPGEVAGRSDSLVPLERVEIPYRHFLEDVIYFPHPQGKLIGPRFSLEFRAPGLAEPVRVAFRVLPIGKDAGRRP